MLHVHRAERADRLVEGLGEILLEPLPDPFAPELIAVHTRGMERWVSQRLSARLGASAGRADGVCANVEFPSPARLVRDAVATASGIDAERDPWLPERLVWPLLRVIDDHVDEDWLSRLARHLRGSEGTPESVHPGRRFGAARHLASLLDRYALHRPEMVRAWSEGDDTDGRGNGLPNHGVWQAELWRRVRDRIALPDPAERLESACARLRDEPEIAALPERISLFGLTRLPAGHVAVLQALASERAVHVFVLHPSPSLWERVARETEGRPPVVLRSEDLTAQVPANPLLRSWGKDARELQLVLAASGEVAEAHHSGAHGAASLLARLQSDMWTDKAPPGPPLPGQEDARPVVDPGDLSVRVHACHGRARQVEVMRDAILHALEEDPTLEPRDVLVMCPDIETFAPLIQATFGAAELVDDDEAPEGAPGEGPPPDLRVRLADRALRQTNPLLGVVDLFLDLAAQRLTASQVLDFADREPVRRRFRLDDDDLSQLEAWVPASGIRWGLDAAHRQPFKLQALSAGTWRAGLDRLLLGVSMGEDEQRLFSGILPLGDVPSGAIDLVGRLAELIDRLQAAVDGLSTAKPIDAWAAAMGEAADALTATADWDAWQRAELQRLLDDVVEEAASEGESDVTDLSLAEVRMLFSERLQGSPTRANFRTGHLTICTLMPMRSVPHRVVCLLGLDDGVFPRHGPRDGDDLTLDDPQVGERDPRTEDRQLLLDALLAATERLIVTYTGNDERTNIPQPPAVPVGELLDVIDRTVRTGDAAARDLVLVRHPLQPFDPRNFTPRGLPEGKSWSFKTVDLEGARALTEERVAPGEFLPSPLPELESTLVEVDDLVRFVEHPVRALLRQRLGISLFRSFDQVEDELRVELDGLDRWRVGQRLLEARLGGADMDDAVEAELARGELPPGELARPVIDGLAPIADHIVSEVDKLPSPQDEPASLDIRVDLGERLLSGTVAGVTGDVLRTATFSRVGPKHRIAMWVRLLAVTAAHPDRPFAAVIVGRASSVAARRHQVTIVRIPPLANNADGRREASTEYLTTLLDLYGRGMREPVPIACETSAGYAEARAAGRDPERAARNAWESSWDFDREDRDEAHQLVWAGVRPFDDLLAEEPRSDESGDSWEGSEATRFGRFARRLWGDLLLHEEVEDR